MFRVLFLALFACAAMADSISVSGSCSTNPCATNIVDQYGDSWAYAAVNITDGTTGVSGTVQTGSALTNYYQYLHPGATAPDPNIDFSVTVDLPKTAGILNVFVYAYGQSDECEGCAPQLNVQGLTDGIALGGNVTEYVNVANPSEITLSGNVSTLIQDSTDTLDFSVWWVDPPLSDAPEPAGCAIAGLGLLLLLIKYRSRVNRIDS